MLVHLLRLELLVGLFGFLLQSARVDGSPMVAGAVVAGVLESAAVDESPPFLDLLRPRPRATQRLSRLS